VDRFRCIPQALSQPIFRRAMLKIADSSTINPDEIMTNIPIIYPESRNRDRQSVPHLRFASFLFEVLA